MIVIVKVSARRWIVIDSPKYEHAWRSTAGQQREHGYIYASGTLVAGPADWQTCDRAAHIYAEHAGKIRTAAEWEITQQERAEQLRQANEQLKGRS